MKPPLACQDPTHLDPLPYALLGLGLGLATRTLQLVLELTRARVRVSHQGSATCPQASSVSSSLAANKQLFVFLIWVAPALLLAPKHLDFRTCASVTDPLMICASRGVDNKTAFAPSKAHFTLIPNKTTNKLNLCSPHPRLTFGGIPVKRKNAVKLVGFLFDMMTIWTGMIAGIAKKARQRIGMLTRLRPLLDDQSMETMYTAGLRPTCS